MNNNLLGKKHLLPKFIKKKSYKKKVHLKNRPNIFTSSAYKKFN